MENDLQKRINDLESIVYNHTHRGYDRTPTLPSSDITVQTFTAAEAISANVPVRITLSSETILDNSANTGDNSREIRGSTGTMEMIATPFTPASTTFVTSIDVRMNKTGTPTDNVLVDIMTDNAGVPSGSTVISSQASVSASTISTEISGFVVYSLTFPTPIPLTGSTQYWLVFSRSGARDTSNFVRVDGKTSGGGGAQRDSGTWATGGTNRELYVLIYRNDGTAGEIKKALGLDILQAQVIGITPRAITSGEVGDVKILGVAENLSGLTPGSTYYLSNTGTLATTAGTYSKKLGVALTSSKLSIMLTPN